MLTINDYIQALRSPICERIFKMEFLDENMNVTGENTANVLNGSLNIELNSNARRTCSLTFDNTRGIYIPNEDSDLWINKKFRLYTGLKINGEEWLNLRGTFVVGNPSLSSAFSSKTVSLSGHDKWDLLNGTLGGTLEDTFIIPSGSSIADAVDLVLSTAGDTMSPIVGYTDVTTPSTISRLPGNTYSEMLVELAGFMSWEVFYDTEGRLRFQPPLDFATESSVWDFSTGETTYKGATHLYEFDEIYNVVIVIGDNINSMTIKGIAEDTNIFSPFNIYKIPRKPFIITDNIIHTELFATQRAEYELKKKIALQESITVKAFPVDLINEGEIVTVEDLSCDLNRDRCQVQSISYPLRNEGEMTLTLWKERTF